MDWMKWCTRENWYEYPTEYPEGDIGQLSLLFVVPGSGDHLDGVHDSGRLSFDGKRMMLGRVPTSRPDFLSSLSFGKVVPVTVLFTDRTIPEPFLF